MNLGTIWAELGLKLDQFDAALRHAESQIVAAGREMEARAAAVGARVSAAMERAAAGSQALLKAVTGAAAGLGAAGLAGVKLAADMEQARIGFTTMLGSAERADTFLRQLWDFAARTPFEFKGLQDSARQFLAFGFAAEDVIPTLTAVGNAVAGLGGGAFEIERVTRALGQMRAKGKVSAEEMMQLAEVGIPAWEMLAKAIGTDIPTAMQKAEKEGIPAAVAISALVQGMNEKFPDMMAQQSQTLMGMWSTAKDNVTGVLRVLGKEIIKAFDLKPKLAGAIEALSSLASLLQEKGLRGALAELVPPVLEQKLVLVAGAIAGALVPALYALASGIIAATAPLLPFMAIGAAVAGLAYLIYKNWDGIVGFFQNLWQGVSDATTEAVGAIRDWLTSTWASIRDATVKVWDAIKSWLDKWWETLLVVFTGGLGILILLIVKNWDRISQATTAAWNAISGFLGQAWNGIATAASTIWARIADTVAGLALSLKDRVIAALTPLWDWFRGLAESAWEWGRNLMQAFARGIGSVQIPLPSFRLRWHEGPLGIQIPDLDIGVIWKALQDIIPFLAEGGIVTRPTLAVVGERGREAVVPLDRAGAFAGPINVSVLLDGRVIAQATAPHLVREIRLRGGV